MAAPVSNEARAARAGQVAGHRHGQAVAQHAHRHDARQLAARESQRLGHGQEEGSDAHAQSHGEQGQHGGRAHDVPAEIPAPRPLLVHVIVSSAVFLVCRGRGLALAFQGGRARRHGRFGREAGGRQSRPPNADGPYYSGLYLCRTDRARSCTPSGHCDGAASGRRCQRRGNAQARVAATSLISTASAGRASSATPRMVQAGNPRACSATSPRGNRTAGRRRPRDRTPSRPRRKSTQAPQDGLGALEGPFDLLAHRVRHRAVGPQSDLAGDVSHAPPPRPARIQRRRKRDCRRTWRRPRAVAGARWRSWRFLVTESGPPVYRRPPGPAVQVCP